MPFDHSMLDKTGVKRDDVSSLMNSKAAVLRRKLSPVGAIVGYRSYFGGYIAARVVQIRMNRQIDYASRRELKITVSASG